MMKYLVVLVVVVAVLWLVRSTRRAGSGVSSRPQGPGAPAESMVRCAHCGVHLPHRDALAGPGGRLYCSEAHRLAGPAAPS